MPLYSWPVPGKQWKEYVNNRLGFLLYFVKNSVIAYMVMMRYEKTFSFPEELLTHGD